MVYSTAVTTIKNLDVPVTNEDAEACPGLLGGVEWNVPTGEPSPLWLNEFTGAPTVLMFALPLARRAAISGNDLESVARPP